VRRGDKMFGDALADFLGRGAGGPVGQVVGLGGEGEGEKRECGEKECARDS